MTAKNSRGERCVIKRISIRSLEQAVIDNLLDRVLTMDNLRPLAENIAASRSEQSQDAGIRISALEDKLADVE